MLEPKTRRGRRTREQILEAAADLIHLHGVHGTSIDDILAASGAGKSQLYHYFGSKETLVREVARRQARRILEEIEEAELDSWEGIAAWFAAIETLHAQRGCVGGCPLGTLAAEMADQDPGIRREMERAFAGWREEMRQGLAAMRERGELTAGADPETLADLVVAAQQGGILLAKTAKDIRPLRNALTHAMAHLRSFAAGDAAGLSEG